MKIMLYKNIYDFKRPHVEIVQSKSISFQNQIIY